jgi:hypothetical protein
LQPPYYNSHIQSRNKPTLSPIVIRWHFQRTVIAFRGLSFPASAPWMSLGVCLAQLYESGVRVYLRGGNTLVSEEFLHTLYARPICEHRRCEGMTEHVRRAFLHCRDLGDIPYHILPYLFRRHAQSLVIHEQGTIANTELLVTLRLIVREFRFKFRSERYQPLLIALAQDLQTILNVVD